MWYIQTMIYLCFFNFFYFYFDTLAYRGASVLHVHIHDTCSSSSYNILIFLLIFFSILINNINIYTVLDIYVLKPTSTKISWKINTSTQ